MSDPFIGLVTPVAFQFAPMGWSICQGQTMTITQYQALYSLLGTAFGGDGRTTFMLPNLTGRNIIGAGTLTIPAGRPGAGTYTYPFGVPGGAPKSTLTQIELPSHSHTATFTGGKTAVSSQTAAGSASLPFSASPTLTVTGSAKIATAAVSGTTTPTANAVLAKAPGGQGAIYAASSTTADLTIGPANGVTGTATGTVSGNATGQISLAVNTGEVTSAGTVTVSPTGSGQPFSTIPPYLPMLYLIAVEGLYPTRP